MLPSVVHSNTVRNHKTTLHHVRVLIERAHTKKCRICLRVLVVYNMCVSKWWFCTSSPILRTHREICDRFVCEQRECVLGRLGSIRWHTLVRQLCSSKWLRPFLINQFCSDLFSTLPELPHSCSLWRILNVKCLHIAYTSETGIYQTTQSELSLNASLRLHRQHDAHSHLSQFAHFCTIKR